MTPQAITVLSSKLSPHVSLSKSRLETLSLLIVAMVSARTVNLSHLACEGHVRQAGVKSQMA